MEETHGAEGGHAEYVFFSSIGDCLVFADMVPIVYVYRLCLEYARLVADDRDAMSLGI